MDVLWLTVLVVILGGWSVLDGFVIGLGMLLPRLADGPVGRRLVLTGMGPFFLPNEVWLIAAAGVMTAAFPHFEANLLSGCWPIVIAMLASWIAKDAATWFRSRREPDQWRTFWDRTLAAACLCFALSFGLLVGNILEGLPGAGGREFLRLFNPFTVLCALATALLFALHGASFVALRVPGAPAERARRLAAMLLRPALAALALAAVAGVLWSGVRDAVVWPVPALVLLVAGAAAVVLSGRAATARPGRAFALTAIGAATPVLVALTGLGATVLKGGTDAASLSAFASMAVPVLPVLLLAQAWLWWTFRHPVGDRSPVFF
ncbi:cytochrome d ubiquinol oxidase subunit II [Sphaerisporangium fuscum]|uniref:cytochrome d ubiquinol oxidase subunit II n=1 Tax=Sphaerisporangium fuscum TaxID=2835868 RepID=UPI001BDC2C47|nr:cytochrome d ubiquinol oxidase subunit II [Sphaerisporangium fuscum]